MKHALHSDHVSSYCHSLCKPCEFHSYKSKLFCDDFDVCDEGVHFKETLVKNSLSLVNSIHTSQKSFVMIFDVCDDYSEGAHFEETLVKNS